MTAIAIVPRRADNVAVSHNLPAGLFRTKITCESLDDQVEHLIADWEPQPNHFTFEGNGAQNAAAEAAKAAGLTRYAAFRVDRAEDSTMAPEAVPGFITDRRHREVFEVVRGDLPFRAIIDLDGCDEAAGLLTVDDFEAIASHVTQTAIACGVPEVGANGDAIGAPLVVSFRPDKASAHVVALGWLVADGPTGRAFGRLVLDTFVQTQVGQELRLRLSRIGPDAWKKLWDLAKCGPASHKSTMCMRLPGVPKLDGRRGRVIPGSVLVPTATAPAEWGLDPTPWLLQGDPDHEGAHIITMDDIADAMNDPDLLGTLSYETRDSPSKSACSRAPAGPVKALEDYPAGVVADALADIRARMAEICPDLEEDGQPTEGSVISYTRTRPGHCCVHDREHDSAGAFVRIAPGGLLVASCRRPDALPLVVAPLDPPTPAAPPPSDGYDGFIDDVDGMPTSTADVIASMQWNAEAFAKALKTAADLYLKASYKTGKTRMVEQLIAGVTAQNPRARVAMVTMRQTLTSKLVSDFGFTDYRDAVTRAGGDRQKLMDILSAAQFIVCQVDSFGKIPVDAPAYDLVVSDEVTALLSHVFQPESIAKGYTRAIEGFTSAAHHMARAGRLYACDADLTREQVRAFKLVRRGRPAQVLHNTYQAFKNVPARMVLGKAGRVEVTRQIVDKVMVAVENIRAARPFTGVEIAVHSVREAEGLAEQLRTLVVTSLSEDEVHRIKLYTGRSSPSEKRKDFADATASWADAIAVIYTTAMTVGVSGECPHIEDAFGLFQQGSDITDATSCQMLFRARELKRITLSVTGNPAKGLPLTVEDLAAWSTRAANRSTIPGPLHSGGNPFAPQGVETSPETFQRVLGNNFVGSMWICDALTRNRSKAFFLPRLRDRLEAAGCVVEVVDLGGDMKHLQKAAKVLRLRAPSVMAVRAVVDTSEDADRDQETANVLRGAAVSKQEAMEAATAERFKQAAEAFPDELATCRAVELEGQAYKDYVKTRQPCGDPAAEVRQIHGQAATFVVKTFEDRGGLSADDLDTLADLSATDPGAAATWHRYHERHAEPYKNLTVLIEGKDAYSDRPTVGGATIGVTSGREVGALVRQAFDALGVSDSLTAGGEPELPVARLRDPSVKLLGVMTELVDHGLRVLGDKHAPRKAKTFKATRAKGKTPTLRAAIGLLGPALEYIGAYLAPVYPLGCPKTHKTPTSYRLGWVWTRDPEIERADWFIDCETPVPAIQHPVDSSDGFQSI